jgi:hypothetical protein
MARQDPFSGSRLEKVEDYAKNVLMWAKRNSPKFYRVYDSTFGRYVYFCGHKYDDYYFIRCIYDRGDWYRIKKGTTYPFMKVNPKLIKVTKAGPRVEKKLAHSLWKQNWIQYI